MAWGGMGQCCHMEKVLCPGGTLILLREAAQFFHTRPPPLPPGPAARKTPEFPTPAPSHPVLPVPRGENHPGAGMASDFCYVATGRPGLGLGQGVLGKGRLADGPGAAGAEVEPLGFNSSTKERGGGQGLGLPWEACGGEGQCPWGTQCSASLPPRHLSSLGAP